MNDPWSEIVKPSGSTVNAKRSDENHPYDFFWALDIDGHCLFIYEYEKELELGDKKPKLNGISIIEFGPEGGDKKRLILSKKSTT